MHDLDRLLRHLPQPFTTPEALATGISAGVLSRAVARGDLVRLTRGLYASRSAQGEPETAALLLARAAVRLHPGTAISHHSAAALWRLPRPRHRPQWVALTASRNLTDSAHPSFVRLHDATLSTRHITSVDGLPVTIPERTVLDCLRHLSLPDAVAIGDAALRRGLVTHDGLRAMRRLQRRWPGVTKAARGIPLLDPGRETWLESWSFARLWQLGVPLPASQVTVLDRLGRFVARVDGMWFEDATVAEADGAGKYLGEFDGGATGDLAARRVVREKEREDRLRDLGLQVVRWSTEDIVRRPAEVAARVQQARQRGDLATFTGVLVPAPNALVARQSRFSAL